MARGIEVTLYSIAERYVGTREIPGTKDNYDVMSFLTTDDAWPEHDEVPWCSGFMNYCARLLRLPRSKSLRARSWLQVGRPIDLAEARCGFDVVIFRRGSGEGAAGPEVIDAPGHVALYGRLEGAHVWVLGGNQSDQVCLAPYERGRVIGVRRLWPAVDGGGC